MDLINQLIQEHYREPDCSLSYIAEQIGMSSAYISRIYKQLTLRRIPDEIGACRMELARKLLAEKRDMSIEQIAEEVGFTSSSYFSKAFKKDHGMSPKEYRISGVGEDEVGAKEDGEKNPLREMTHVRAIKEHPIAKGVGDFSERDEHYQLAVTVPDADIFMMTSSEHGGTFPSGYARQYGKGRVAALTPGHTLAIWENPNFQRLFKNAIRWCAGQL